MSEKINIAIVGFGNIGSYFYKILEKNKINISNKTGKIPVVKYICARNINKRRLIKIPKSKWIKNATNLPLMDDVDIIVELVGGSDGLAKKLAFSTLKNKKRTILKVNMQLEVVLMFKFYLTYFLVFINITTHNNS